MIKIRCLGSRPYGRHPIFIEELNKLVFNGEEIDGKDATYADILCKKYPGCLEIVEEKPQPKPEKMVKQVKDKMLQSSCEDKEFV